jgi:pyroglutamyl-peptidase
METIILTGFEPFGGYKYNPTQKSTLDFHGKVIGNKKVIGIVLPCTYRAWYYLSSLMQEKDRTKIICTGLSSSAQGVRIETKFQNLMNGKYPDATGYSPKNVPLLIDNISPEFTASTAFNGNMFNLLTENNIPSELSSNAGNFICNSLGYLTSLYANNPEYNFQNLFVHIPWTTDYEDKVKIEEGKIFLNQELYYEGLDLLVKNL